MLIKRFEESHFNNHFYCKQQGKCLASFAWLQLLQEKHLSRKNIFCKKNNFLRLSSLLADIYKDISVQSMWKCNFHTTVPQLSQWYVLGHWDIFRWSYCQNRPFGGIFKFILISSETWGKVHVEYICRFIIPYR